jgi:transcriptional regulator with XRE-family HTH domain
MTDLRKLLASNLKKYRKLNGFTQEKLAEETHAAASYIGMIETGRKVPSAEMLSRLASLLREEIPGEIPDLKEAVHLLVHLKAGGKGPFIDEVAETASLI